MAKGQRQKLSLRVSRFVDALLSDPESNATKAAIRAGYSAKTAESQASRLLRNAKVRAVVDEAKDKAARAADVTVLEVLTGLRREAYGEGPDTSSNARTTALVALGKTLKMFTEKVELSGRLTLEELVRESMKGDQ